MKKRTSLILLSFLLSFFVSFALSGCKKTDYFAYLSDERSDLFLAETERYTLTVSCVEREHPFFMDGIVSPRAKTVEIVLAEKEPSGETFEVYLLEDMPRGGEMSFRSVTGDWYFSRGVENFPTEAVSIRVISGDNKEELTATSVKTPKTLSPRQALDFAVSAERETIDRMTQGGVFAGEFHVRLLRRDKNYYYVGIVGANGYELSLLLNSETGEVLARREKN